MSGGTRSTGLGIEYVRKRRVVRLVGWHADTPIQPVEIPIDDLCPGLGISPQDFGVAQQFLLFAGSHRRPLGGLRDLVGTFHDEEGAWAAFRRLRQAHPAAQGWAELAIIDATGHVHQLAWFGLHQAEEPDEAPAVPRRTASQRLHAADSYLRAVTPS